MDNVAELDRAREPSRRGHRRRGFPLGASGPQPQHVVLRRIVAFKLAYLHGGGAGSVERNCTYNREFRGLALRQSSEAVP
jgi:hypothetical protein